MKDFSRDFEEQFALFIEKKSKALAKPDKSKKGSWDKEILPLLIKINSSDFFYTTSSCAGRFILFEAPFEGRNKYNIKWLYVEHDMSKEPCFYISKINEIISSLKKRSDSVLWFKAEPPIIHVATFNSKYATDLLSLAYESGLKKSGIKSLVKNLVEITSSEQIAIPIVVNGKILFEPNEDFVLLAKNMILSSRKRFEDLEKKFEKKFL